MNETDIILQLFSFRRPMVVAVGFQEVCFYHGITACQVDTCHSVAWLQNIHFLVVLSSYRLHSSSMLITETDILSWMFMIYAARISAVQYIKHLMVGKFVNNYWK
jgi:hypothetical protein